MNVDIVKGKQIHPIGALKTFGGREYIKTSTGWKYHGKGTGAKAQAHAEEAKGIKRIERIPTTPMVSSDVKDREQYDQHVEAAAEAYRQYKEGTNHALDALEIHRERAKKQGALLGFSNEEIDKHLSEAIHPPKPVEEAVSTPVESSGIVTQDHLDRLESLRKRAEKDKWKGWAAKELKKEAKSLVTKVYQHSKVRKALAEINLQTTKYYTTAIRGYKGIHTAGFEISTYDPSTISFQVSPDRVDSAEKILQEKGLFVKRIDSKTIKIKPTSEQDAQKVKPFDNSYLF